MTLIFGSIDFPVFEMLFIVSIVQLIGLFLMVVGIFIVLKEIKSLKILLRKEEELIEEEEKDIKEFENDLNSFEGKNSDTDAAQSYIKDMLSKGFAWRQIKEHLITQGWKAEQLEELYRAR